MPIDGTRNASQMISICIYVLGRLLIHYAGHLASLPLRARMTPSSAEIWSTRSGSSLPARRRASSDRSREYAGSLVVVSA